MGVLYWRHSKSEACHGIVSCDYNPALSCPQFSSTSADNFVHLPLYQHGHNLKCCVTYFQKL